MNIGDLFLRILANDLGFEADLMVKAGKAGDKAGQTLGQRMGKAVKAGGALLPGAGAALAVAVAFWGEGVVEAGRQYNPGAAASLAAAKGAPGAAQKPFPRKYT